MAEDSQNNAKLEKIFWKYWHDSAETFTVNQLMKQSGSSALMKSLSLAADP